MYARITRFTYNDKGYANREIDIKKIVNEVGKIEGVHGYYSLVNEKKEALLVALYDSQEKMQQAMPKVNSLFQQFSDTLASAPEREEFQVLGALEREPS